MTNFPEGNGRYRRHPEPQGSDDGDQGMNEEEIVEAARDVLELYEAVAQTLKGTNLTVGKFLENYSTWVAAWQNDHEGQLPPSDIAAAKWAEMVRASE